MSNQWDRPKLTFDGFGINGPDEYRTRIATFTRTNTEEGIRPEHIKYGPLFAASPDLLEACKDALRSLKPAGNVRKDYEGHLAYAALSKAIAKAEGRVIG